MFVCTHERHIVLHIDIVSACCCIAYLYRTCGVHAVHVHVFLMSPAHGAGPGIPSEFNTLAAAGERRN